MAGNTGNNRHPSAEAPSDGAVRSTLWGDPRYRTWFTADTASTLGAALKGFAISLIAFSLCHSLVWSGWVTTAAMIASQATSLFGGTVVDRHNRKRLVILNAASGTVLWLAVALLLALKAMPFLVFAALVVAASAVNGLLGGATNALLRSIITMADYPKAQAANQARDSVIDIAGSPLGGMLYAVAPWMPFAVASLMYAVSGVSATQIRVSEHIRDRFAGAGGGNGADGDAHTGAGRGDDGDGGDGASRGATSFLHDFAEGWVWLAHRPKAIAIAVIVSLINFGINGILSAAELHLVGVGVDSMRIGLFSAAGGVGMLVGAAVATRIVGRVPVGGGILAIAIIEPLTLAPLLVTHAYPAIVVCTMLVGLPVATASALLSGFLMSKTPVEMQGRLGSAVGLLSMVPTAFCSALAGSLLHAVGFTATAAVFIVIFAVNIVIVLAMPSIRAIPRSDRWGEVGL